LDPWIRRFTSTCASPQVQPEIQAEDRRPKTEAQSPKAEDRRPNTNPSNHIKAQAKPIRRVGLVPLAPQI
jgi:hypothetical protein